MCFLIFEVYMKFIETPEPVYVNTVEEATTWLNLFSKCKSIGFDTETTGLSIIRDRIKYFSIANETNRICAPVRLLPIFKSLLEDETISKRMTNAKYDIHMAANSEIYIRGQILDTICMDFLLDENRQGQHGLKETARDYLGLRMAPFSTVFGNLKGGKDQAVLMLIKMHDCIEANDKQFAMQILAELGKISKGVDPEVVDGIVKLTASIAKDYTYTTKSLLAIARKCGVCGKTTGRQGFVVDVANYMGFGVDDSAQTREDFAWIMENDGIKEDMHDKLLYDLTQLIPQTDDPIDILKLVVADYASLDAWATYALVDKLREELSAIEVYPDGALYNLYEYYEEWYEPLLNIAWDMERYGFRVNTDKCAEVEQEILAQIEDIQREVTKKMGKVINLNSSAQIKEYFYQKHGKVWKDVMGDQVKFWSTGGVGGEKTPSTKKEALDYFAEKGEQVAILLLEHRKLKKIQEFVHSFPEVADDEGRIHSTLVITGAVTGRWASRDPNLQNIPSKGDLGKLVRDLFIAAPGHQLIVADYGQLEMRIMAHYANETAMIDAIANGKDLHSVTASLAGGYDYDEVVAANKKKDTGEKLTDRDKELCAVRRNMKAVGFGLNYGIGPAKLGRQLGLPTKIVNKNGMNIETCPEGQELINKYFGVYPNIQKYIEATKEYAIEHLFVQTLSGRFRRLPEVNSKDKAIRAKAQRQAANTVIQGSATDIMNSAVIKMYRNNRLKELGVKVLLQVHDELIFECPDDEATLAEAKAIIQDCMENAWPMQVPLEAEPGHGYTWEKAK